MAWDALDNSVESAPQELSLHRNESLDAFDAFGILPVHMDSEDIGLLQLLVNAFVDSRPVADNSRSLTVGRIAQSIPIMHTRECMSNVLTMASLLAFLASFSESLRHTGPGPKSGRWMARALKELQSKLSVTSKVTPEHLKAMAHLAASELHRGNEEGAKIHLRAVKAALPAVGGMCALEPFLRLWLIRFDTLLACQQMTAPILDLTYDPGPASGRTKAPYPPCMEKLESMGTGFAKMSAEIKPQSLVEIATEVVECTRIHTEYYNWQGSDAADITEWVLLRRAASRYKLLTVEVEILQQQAVQIALLIFTFSRYRGSWSYRSVKILGTRLRETLELLQHGCWDGEAHELYQWVILAAALATEDSPDGVYFVGEIQEVFDDRLDLDVCNPSIRSVFSKFSHLSQSQGERVDRLVRAVARQGASTS